MNGGWYNKVQTVLYYDGSKNGCQHAICPIPILPNIFKKSFFQGWKIENLGSFRAQLRLKGKIDHSLELTPTAMLD
jgi:hypothetical protein